MDEPEFITLATQHNELLVKALDVYGLSPRQASTYTCALIFLIVDYEYPTPYSVSVLGAFDREFEFDRHTVQ